MTAHSARFKLNRAVLFTALLSLATMGGSVDVTLTPSGVREAIRSGASMVSPGNGYQWAPYVLHEYTTGVFIDPSTPLVDAVTVATPFERVRYSSYLEGFQKKVLATSAANQIAQENANKVTFILYTHGPKSVEAELEAWQQTYVTHGVGEQRQKVQRTYLDDFKPATLTVNGQTLTSTLRIEGPYQDAFSTKGKPEFRNLGVIYYQFDLAQLAQGGKTIGSGILRFKDPVGRSYSENVNLARYR